MEIVPARMLKVTRRRWSEGVFRLGTRPFVRTTDERSRRRGRGRRKRGMGGEEERLMCSEGRRDAHCEPRCRCSLGFFFFFFPFPPPSAAEHSITEGFFLQAPLPHRCPSVPLCPAASLIYWFSAPRCAINHGNGGAGGRQ